MVLVVSSDQPPAAPESSAIPKLLAGLVDDAAVFPPGDAPLAEAVPAHHGHRRAWYAALVGVLLVPWSSLDAALRLGAGPRVGAVVADPQWLAGGQPWVPGPAVQLEVAVARRGEEPHRGLARLVALAATWPGVRVYAEVPLTTGLFAALDALAEARAGGLDIAAKFRTGGLAAELFPSPTELAAVICGCRDRGLPFKLTAGLHHAVRHTDPDTGFAHHGFLNVLVATLLAADGADGGRVSRALAGTEARPMVAEVAGRLAEDRPLWTAYGSCDIAGPVADLVRTGLVTRGEA